MIKIFWTKLDTRQRYLIAVCVTVVFAVMMMELAIFPLWDARAKMKKSIQSQSKKLEEIVKIDSDFTVQDAKISRIKSAVASHRADFTLFAYLEKKAVSSNVKGSIKQMNSMQGVKSASLEETLIDMKLEKITIKQLADFLYQIELPAEPIKIKRIIINKMKESPDYITVQLLIASTTPVPPRSGGQ